MAASRVLGTGGLVPFADPGAVVLGAGLFGQGLGVGQVAEKVGGGLNCVGSGSSGVPDDHRVLGVVSQQDASGLPAVVGGPELVGDDTYGLFGEVYSGDGVRGHGGSQVGHPECGGVAGSHRISPVRLRSKGVRSRAVGAG